MMSNVVRFRILGTLPAPWEDFFCLDEAKGYPHITILTRAEADENGVEDADGTDGWLDLIVDVDFIDEDTARLVIADALGIDNPELIGIEQAAFAQSV